MKDIIARRALEEDGQIVKILTDEMEASAFSYGSPMSELFPAFIIEKIKDGKAVIAVTKNNIWVGFSYLQLQGNAELLSDSGFTIDTAYRVYRIPSPVKEQIFELLKELYPNQSL